ncbi:MAG: hypothetical protein B7X06_03940, partial [Verrucomicrobia bacterium 21-51-4]
MVLLIEAFFLVLAVMGAVVITRAFMLSRINVAQARLAQVLEEGLLRKEEANQRFQQAQAEIAQLHAQLHESVRGQAAYQAKAEALEQSSEEKLKLLGEARETLMQSFQALSAEVFQANNQAFLTLAEQTLGQFQAKTQGDWQKRAQTLTEVAVPLQERLQLL